MRAKRAAIGARIRALRQDRGLTQDELAAKMQLEGHTTLDQTAHSKVELGVRDVSLLEALSYAKILGVPLSAIAGGDNHAGH